MDTKQPFYITCAIPYTNAPAHIGHALEFTQSDVLARYHRSLGEDVLLSHGADEHGSKNYKTALEIGLDPKAFADDITPKFIKIHEALNIAYDRFIRTTSPEHKKAAQTLWKKLEASGDIYKSKYEGLYCVGCETFVTDVQARENKGVCPTHEKPYEKLVEENYFFRLSKYLMEIEEAIKTDRIHIVPETRKHEALALIGEGLPDLSASRPITSLPWGIPVPGDKDQIMYVWFEALMYYLTALGYPAGDMEHYWPAQIQVIGKDILRFHALIWPAILLSAGLELPKALSVHGFVSMDGKKMSKSLGNTIDPFEAVDQYGADAFRYYLLRHIPSHDDGDFTWEKFEQSYNSELADDLGNLIYRTASMLNRYQGGAIGQVPEAEHDENRYHEALGEFRFDRALDTVWEQIHSLNQYIEEEKPWELAKEDKDHLSEVLGYLVGSLLQIADLLEPFLPATSAGIKGTFKDGIVSSQLKPLFPKIYQHTPDPKAQ